MAKVKSAGKKTATNLSELAVQKLITKYRAVAQPLIIDLIKGHNPDRTLGILNHHINKLILEANTIVHQNSENHFIKLAQPHLRKKLSLAAASSIQRNATISAKKRSIEEIHKLYAPRISNEVNLMTSNLAKAIKQSVQTSVSKSEPLQQTISRLKNTIDASGLDPQTPWAIETIARTETMIAFSSAQKDIASDPAIDSILWGYEFSVIEDSRAEHLDLQGIILHKDDPQVEVLRPPLRMNCRCSYLPLFEAPEGYQVPQVNIPRELPSLE